DLVMIDLSADRIVVWYSGHSANVIAVVLRLLPTHRTLNISSARGSGKNTGMAKLVFEMGQSLDGYVDHMAFGPLGPILFRLFACICISLVGLCSAVVTAQDIEPITTAYVTWSPHGRYIASATSTTVDIIEVSSGDIKNSFPIDRVTHSAAVWSPDGQKIAFATS